MINVQEEHNKRSGCRQSRGTVCSDAPTARPARNCQLGGRQLGGGRVGYGQVNGWLGPARPGAEQQVGGQDGGEGGVDEHGEGAGVGGDRGDAQHEHL